MTTPTPTTPALTPGEAIAKAWHEAGQAELLVNPTKGSTDGAIASIILKDRGLCPDLNLDSQIEEIKALFAPYFAAITAHNAALGEGPSDEEIHSAVFPEGSDPPRGDRLRALFACFATPSAITKALAKQAAEIEKLTGFNERLAEVADEDENIKEDYLAQIADLSNKLKIEQAASHEASQRFYTQQDQIEALQHERDEAVKEVEECQKYIKLPMSVPQSYDSLFEEVKFLRVHLEEVVNKEQEPSFHQRMGITLLDAKWLDPACHTGCQSLKWKGRIDEALRHAKLALGFVDGDSPRYTDIHLRACIAVLEPAPSPAAVEPLSVEQGGCPKCGKQLPDMFPYCSCEPASDDAQTPRRPMTFCFGDDREYIRLADYENVERETIALRSKLDGARKFMEGYRHSSTCWCDTCTLFNPQINKLK